MNVRETNDTGHGIWSFVVTALVMLLSSMGAWLIWRACRNMKLAHEVIGLRDSMQHKWSWQKAIVALTGMRAHNDQTIGEYSI